MYMIVGQNYWRKHEYDLEECLVAWLKDTHYKTSGQCVAFKFKDCKFEDVQMDEMGTLTWPKEKLVWRYEIDLEKLATYIKKLDHIMMDLDEVMSDIYIAIEDDIEALEDD